MPPACRWAPANERGAFTGAVKSSAGRLELANGGTLLLDEIGDMPLLLQVKLLRFLEDRSIQRVGGRADIDIDARIVSATHRPLLELVGEGRFREDLYYRIAELTIDVPPHRLQAAPRLRSQGLKPTRDRLPAPASIQP